MSANDKNRAVFLDRDKTVIEDPGYINDPDLIHLLPRAGEAVKMLNAAGYLVVIVTNQSGVARGLVTEDRLTEIHQRLRDELGARGARVDAIYYCPFHPEGIIEKYTRVSEMRKPQPGMLLQAAGEMNIDLTQSWMIGDSAIDVEAGQRAGCRTIRLAPSEEALEEPKADMVAPDLYAAAELVLGTRNK
jgi:D-glycero-D-manno-heptose 1,7-bisphosphate phosphatase